MDIPSIETFLFVAKKQSFSLTAEALYLTQPAISKRIASLESELDCKLFDRVKKKIMLTEAGQIFLPRAQNIIEELKAGKNALSEMDDLVSGELDIATSHHIGLHYLPPILKKFVNQYPKVDLKLNFMESESACHAVENAEIELAVITLPIEPIATLVQSKIWEDPLTFVVHNNHCLLDERKQVNGINTLLTHEDIEKLTQFPAILSEKGTYTRQLIDAYFHQSGMDVQVKLSNNYLETIKMMVSVGLGWSVLPQTLIDSTLTAITIPGFNAHRSLGIVTHKNRTLSHVAQKMSELITKAI
ncbi:MAG: LysR family transcriptional regulator [gamma proteobacterium symbiont of Lucinoma myriamae]|nr:LysR family transcriptional regulator [gamma proteobacterium symbiont of Lucinoma myriamae]MCU7819675.1 LysR family transcriptional regulator [gamma proteobacterium symbiont of Lucinoma myriamae]